MVSIVGFDDPAELDKTEQSLADLRGRLGVGDEYEFKYSGLNRNRRTLAIEASLAGQFWFYSFTLNKPYLFEEALRKKDAMYHKVASWLFANALTDVAGADIVLDRCGNRDFYRAIYESLGSLCERRGRPKPKSFRAKDSHEYAGLQVADLVCGTVARLHSSKSDNGEHFALLRGRSRSVRYWPQK